ncbi:diaminopimelate epimerase [Haladaptatus sp. F3-133]|uniref:Diaminopimelate epimerase n=1 Tax=Halorutilus salinus TaxID=2487751 RepID=A0A9Q4GG69_9EURY|nr:diaminopimelate epimerase [Halorutilus salinus]MCX2818839.1 diaminopimelate epimerase [Halorutilus salinus]
MTAFTKAHGNGNDFVIVDEWNANRVDEDEKASFAERYCDRRRGVGGDGVVFVSEGDDADARMRLYQPDGDTVEMCGNALRCIARFCVERGYFEDGEAFDVETGAGRREVVWNADDETARVEMGVPSFDAEDVPAHSEVIEEEVAGRTVTAVNTGVPHAVIFADNVGTVNVEDEAPRLRHADVFPDGANVNFAEEADDGYTVRTFERGVEGETLACGTGAVGVAAVARRLHGAGDEVKVETRGGELVVGFDDGVAYLRGDAELVYEGETL